MLHYLFLMFILIFLPGCEEKTYTIPIGPGPSKEEIDKEDIEGILETFEKAIESDEAISIYTIEKCFSKFYEASDDKDTKELINQGLIPANYIEITPTYVTFFKNYKDIEIEKIGDSEIVLNGDKATVLVAYSVKAIPVDENLPMIEIIREDNFTFTRVGPDWKIIKWASKIKHEKVDSSFLSDRHASHSGQKISLPQPKALIERLTQVKSFELNTSHISLP